MLLVVVVVVLLSLLQIGESFDGALRLLQVTVLVFFFGPCLFTGLRALCMPFCGLEAVDIQQDPYLCFERIAYESDCCLA